ncbi:protein DpdD [Massilia sp. YIM B02769]|uniref:protein DpdD n=1 Tax=Massilia sp. YIM B02769 TaxID=3050129 RepID=UPI0025B64E99|nr:protein DpdD [Massilia sp. YIM B02769]MDN4058013.1 protein DpdD [Massilia sp. YIM B02769]
MQGIEAAERAWLERYFAAPNALTWDALNHRSAPPAWLAQVTPWLDLFVQRANRVPIVLPVFDEQGPCMWYAAANSAHQAAALGEELASFIGPSYSDFLGHPHRCDPNNPIEAALRERFGEHVYRLAPQDEPARAQITRALNLYLGLLRRRPPTPDRTQQPFGKLRADFDRALLAGNEATASQLLEALCASGRVNAEQRKFLEIRLLAGLGRQQELAHNSSLLKVVMDLSLPPQTIADLIGAVYETFVAAIETAPPHEVAATFQRHIGQHFGALFEERKGVRQPNVLKAFFLYEATREDPDQTRLNVIESAYPDDSQGKLLLQQWREQLLQSAQPEPFTLDRTAAASKAILDDEYETAAMLYLQMLPALSAYSGLLRCFPQLDDLALAETVRGQLDAMPKSLAEQLSERDRKRLASSRSPAPVRTSAPGWLEWAQDVAAHRYAGKDLAVLNDSVSRWTIEDYVHDPVKCEDLAAIVTNADGKADMVFRHAFAPFVEFFVNRTASPVRGFVPLYAMLIKMVAWNGGASADELELVAALALNFLGAVPDKQTYVDTVDDLGEILAANRAATQIDWTLNIAELLAIYPTPDPEARLRFFVLALDLVRANSHRISVAQRRVLQLLAHDYGCENLLIGLPEPATAETTQLATFAGLIALYTLTEPAAQRAREVLRSIAPNAQIEITSDTVATDRLRHLSSKADVFVFAWRSSKHQAYYCVKENRGNRSLSMPAGKGAASIVHAALVVIAALLLN